MRNFLKCFLIAWMALAFPMQQAAAYTPPDLPTAQSLFGKPEAGSLPNLQKQLSSYDITNQPIMWIVGYGSSIGTLSDLNGNTTSYNVCQQIIKAFNRGSTGYFKFQCDNESVGGQTVFQFASGAGNQWTATISKVTFTGSISGTTLTVSAISGGSFVPGYTITTGTGVASGTVILSQLTGSTGSTGTYKVRVSQTVGSESMVAGIIPSVCVGTWGENDFQTSNYNSGETFGSMLSYFQTMRNTCAAVGADTIQLTSHHYGIMNVSNAPNYPGMDPVVPMTWPSASAAPVSCGNQIPTCANGLIGPFDFMGLGNSLYQDFRFAQGNTLIRQVSSQYGTPLIDAEHYSWAALQRYMLSGGYTQAQAEAYYYTTLGTVHPNATGMSAFYTQAILDWGNALAYQSSQQSIAGAIPVTGDIVSTTTTQIISGQKTMTAPIINGAIIDNTSQLGKADSSGGGTLNCSYTANTAGPVLIAVPDASGGWIDFVAKQSGIGTASVTVQWVREGSTVAVTSPASYPNTGGNPISTITTSTTNVSFALAAANTNVGWCVFSRSHN